MSQDLPDPVPDSEEIRDEHHDLIFAYKNANREGSGEGPFGLLSRWLPDDWKGKTQIAPEQAQALAVVRQIPEMYPELEEYNAIINQMFTDYEKYLTSIRGKSREEQVEVLRSMAGGHGEGGEAGPGLMMTALGAGLENSDE